MYYWNMAKVTIAQLHGYALAGGCEMAMMSDMVTAAEDVRIGHPGVRGLGVARNGAISPARPRHAEGEGALLHGRQRHRQRGRGDRHGQLRLARR